MEDIESLIGVVHFKEYILFQLNIFQGKQILWQIPYPGYFLPFGMASGW